MWLAGAAALALIIPAGIAWRASALTRFADPALWLPQLRSLWLQPDWSPRTLWPLPVAGWAGLALGPGGRIAWNRALPLGAGLLALAWTSHVVVACIADALRYQSVLAAPMVMGVAAVPLCWQRCNGWRCQVPKGVALALACASVWVTLHPMAGDSALSADARAWHALREAFEHQRAPLTFISIPPTVGQMDAQPPVGRWSLNGPTSQSIDTAMADALCQRGIGLPAGSWLVYMPECDAVTRGACAALDRFAGTQAWRRSTPALAPEPGFEIAEFVRFTRQPSIRVVAARCP